MSTSTADSVFMPNGENPDVSVLTPIGRKSNTSSSYSPCLDGFSRFQIHIRNAIEKITSGVSEEEYIEMLGKLTVIKKSKSAPGKIQKRMKSGLTESLLDEMEAMVKDENIKENMKQLDKLVDDSMLDEGRETWRPNGNVKDHMRSHLMEIKLKHKHKLEQIVGDKEKEIECILSQVMTLRTQVRSLESRLLVLKSQSEDTSVVDSTDRKVIDKVDELENV